MLKKPTICFLRGLTLWFCVKQRRGIRHRAVIFYRSVYFWVLLPLRSLLNCPSLPSAGCETVEPLVPFWAATSELPPPSAGAGGRISQLCKAPHRQTRHITCNHLSLHTFAVILSFHALLHCWKHCDRWLWVLTPRQYVCAHHVTNLPDPYWTASVTEDVRGCVTSCTRLGHF